MANAEIDWMKVDYNDVKKLTEDFLHLLNTTPDDKCETDKIIVFLVLCRSFKNPIAPTAEFISIIKHKKPTLYHCLKRSITLHSPLHMILHIDLDYWTALERIGLADQQICERIS